MHEQLQSQLKDMHFQLQDMTLRMSEIMAKAQLNLQLSYNIIQILEGTDDTKKTN